MRLACCRRSIASIRKTMISGNVQSANEAHLGHGNRTRFYGTRTRNGMRLQVYADNILCINRKFDYGSQNKERKPSCPPMQTWDVRCHTLTTHTSNNQSVFVGIEATKRYIMFIVIFTKAPQMLSCCLINLQSDATLASHEKIL